MFVCMLILCVFTASCFVCAGAEKVDIGLPYYRPSRTKEVRERRQVMKANKKNHEMEREARLRTCKPISDGSRVSFTVVPGADVSLSPTS